MAASEIRIFVRAVGGLADCLICNALVSFKLRPPEFERIADLRCPICRGTCIPDEDTFVLDTNVGPM